MRSHSSFLIGLLLLLVNSFADGQVNVIEEFPGPDYFLGLRQLHQGDIEGAAKIFRAAAKKGGAHDLDAVCHHAMLGECLFRLGQYAEALNQFDTALVAYAARREISSGFTGISLFRINGPKSRPDAPAPTWGPPSRKSVPADVPTYEKVFRWLISLKPIRQIPTDEMAAVAVSDIVRCAALAVRRKRTLLGPLAADDPTIGRLARRLMPPRAGNTGAPGTYQRVLIGSVLAALGKHQQAATEFQNGLLLGDQYDHPLTATALIQLGDIAMEQGNYNAASGYYRESTFVAATYGQIDLIEEAFVQGAQIARMNNDAGLQANLESALTWGRKNSKLLEASVSVDLVEWFATNQQSAAAAKLLDLARNSVGRATISAGLIGRRFNYVSALVHYQAANLAGGNSSLSVALAIDQNASLRALRLTVAEALFASGAISDRIANNYYDSLLADPGTLDWQFDPVGSLYSSTLPMPPVAEAWLLAASERKDTAKVLEITERARCRHFHSKLDLGSRLLSVRRILDGPADELTEKAELQKKGLIAALPQYVQLAQAERDSVAALRKLAQADPPLDPKLLNEDAQKLVALGVSHESQLHTIALRREAYEIVFPPLLPAADIQRRIPPRTAVWSFSLVGKNIVSFWIEANRIAYGTTGSPSEIRKELADLLRKLGQYDRNHVLDQELSDGSWRENAKALLGLLNTSADSLDWESYDEIVIVPDGFLWYVPFELLPAGIQGDAEPLIQRHRIRYAPTVGLAVRSLRPYLRTPSTAIVAGKLSPRDSDEFTNWSSNTLREGDPQASRLPANAAMLPDLYTRLFDRLVVLSDIDQSGKAGFDWPPLEDLRGKGPSKFSNWLVSPWGCPEVVVMPGFHTAAENGLKQGADGDELFLTLTGLAASGARTVLLSRWRTGGKTSINLVKELLAETGNRTASEAWQRSVLLALESRLDLANEPRVRVKREGAETAANHPFFWSGYVLVDSGSPYNTQP